MIKKKDISLTVYTCSALYFPALLHLLVLARSSRTHTLSVIQFQTLIKQMFV